MANLTVTSDEVAALFPEQTEIYDAIAAETITAGQAVYLNSSGKVALASASASGTAGARGIALNDAAAGQAVSILKQGAVYGFTLTSLAYDAEVYLSDTDGSLADAAGTVSVQVGRVMALTNTGTLTKVLYLDFDW